MRNDAALSRNLFAGSRVEPDMRGFGIVAIVLGVAGTVAIVVAVRAPASSGDGSDVLRCDGFDAPVGPPEGVGYYDAQPFGVNNHLGNDWNGNGGGDTDLGEPVYAVAAGVVTSAVDHEGGWGNVVRIVHLCGEPVESLYAHLDTITVVSGTIVARGQQIGTIGNAGGHYQAHLHFELRDRWFLPLGDGYAAEHTGYLDPTAYIRAHHVAR